MGPDIELEELRRFLAVAEVKSFRRAAERLRISQPPLSRSIALLESKLRVALFTRTTRDVALTAAGSVLVEQARFVLDAASAAARRTVRAASRGRSLVIAAKPGTGTELLQRLMKRYGEVAPEVRVRVVVVRWGEQVIMLNDGRADVALLHGPITEPGIDAEPLITEPRVVALAATHPLARRRVLRRRDLASDAVCTFAGDDAIKAAYRAGVDRGAMPLAQVPEGPNVTDTAQLVEMIALGQGIAFLPKSAAREYARREVRFVRVSDISPSTLSVAWAETSRSKEVASFVRVATTLARARLAGSGARALE